MSSTVYFHPEVCHHPYFSRIYAAFCLWESWVRYIVFSENEFTLSIHIPSHVQKFTLTINGKAIDYQLRDGYIYISRAWKKEDTVELDFDLPVRRIYADPRVRSCRGKVAVARGPILYCFEEVDQCAPVFSLILPANADISTFGPVPELPGDLIGLCMEGKTLEYQERLYSSSCAKPSPCRMIAIPYFAWANRKKGDMTVWIQEGWPYLIFTDVLFISKPKKILIPPWQRSFQFSIKVNPKTEITAGMVFPIIPAAALFTGYWWLLPLSGPDSTFRLCPRCRCRQILQTEIS